MVENKNKIHGLIVFFLVFQTACVVGPDFRRPETPDVAGYLPDSGDSTTDLSVPGTNDAPSVVEGQPVNPYWWRELGSSNLNTLIEEALQHNLSLKSLDATWRQARQLVEAKSGSNKYPQVDGNVGVQSQRLNPETLGAAGDPKEFNIFNAGVTVRYVFDFAGGNRRALEALAARCDYQQYQLEAAQLALVTNIIATAMTSARLSRHIEILESVLASEEEKMELIRHRIRLGQASEDTIFPQEMRLEQTRGRIPELRNLLQQAGHLMSVLSGRAPGQGESPSFSMTDFKFPTALPLVVPSKLVRKRPDILGAEAIFHVANAEYGVAVSKLYPQLNLSADLGSKALTAGALFNSASLVWGLVAQLTQPLFNPGLPAEKRAALAALEGAAANYQVVVLEALRNVADVLRALKNDSDVLTTRIASHRASQDFLNSVQRKYELGAVSYEDVLLAKQQAQEMEIDLLDVRSRLFLDSVSFYQAMGGGVFSETLQDQK